MQKVKAFVKSHVIDNIKQWHKLATVRFWIIVGVFAQIADVILPYSMMLDPRIANALTILAVVSIALRLYKQKNLHADSPDSPEAT